MYYHLLLTSQHVLQIIILILIYSNHPTLSFIYNAYHPGTTCHYTSTSKKSFVGINPLSNPRNNNLLYFHTRKSRKNIDAPGTTSSIRNQMPLSSTTPSSCYEAWMDTSKDEKESLVPTTPIVNEIQNTTLSAPKHWIQSKLIEANTIDDNTSILNGPYTVIRCDSNKNNKLWNIRGEEFHLNRLQSSFELLYPPTNERINDDNEYETKKTSLRLQTQSILNTLMQQYSTMEDDEYLQLHKETNRILMITILWKISSSSTTADPTNPLCIQVYGHSKILHLPKEYPNPISLSIALPPPLKSKSESKTNEVVVVPNRYKSRKAQAKSYNWIRERQDILESTAFYKPHYIDEVILTKTQKKQQYNNHNNLNSNNDEEEEVVVLLEGLTSNLFIVYNDNTTNQTIIQTTSNEDVLHGYVRECIIHKTNTASFKNNPDIFVRVEDIRLDTVSHWKEVFVTSSIQLVKPVDKVYIPCFYEEKEDYQYSHDSEIIPMKLIWSSDNPKDGEDTEIPIWKQLYDSLVNDSLTSL